MSTKVNKTIAPLVLDEKLEVLNQLKTFLDGNLDDDVTDMLDEFIASLSLKPVKVEKAKTDKPKRTRKPTFYNYWFGQRLKTFAEEQKDVPDDEKVGNGGRMKLIALEWKNFKEGDEFETAKAEWEKLSSDDDDENQMVMVTEKKKKVPSMDDIPSMDVRHVIPSMNDMPDFAQFLHQQAMNSVSDA